MATVKSSHRGNNLEQPTQPEGAVYENETHKWVMSAEGGYAILPEGNQFICSYFNQSSTVLFEDGKFGTEVTIRGITTGTKEVDFPNALRSQPKQLLALLEDHGLEVRNPPSCKALIAAMMGSGLPKKQTRLAKRPGWHETEVAEQLAYLTGKDTFLPNGSTVSIKLEHDSQALYSRKGSLYNWQKNVARYCDKNSRLLFAICSALAAPLLRLIGFPGIGIHFFGPTKGGKTVVLAVANSVFGGKNFPMTWNGTAIGFQEEAARRCDKPMILDEVGEGNADAISGSIYQLINGSARVRSGRKGTHGNTTVVLISAGEETFEELLLKNSNKTLQPGQRVRALPIPGVTRDVMFKDHHGQKGHAEFSAMLKANALNHLGAPGRAFIQYLVSNQMQIRAEMPETVSALTKTFCKSIGEESPDQAMQDVIQRFAIIAYAGELAIKQRILPYAPGTATGAAKAALKGWSRAEKKAEEKRDPAYHAIKQSLAEAKESFVPYADSQKTSSFVYTDNVNGIAALLIDPDFFKNTLCAEHGTKIANISLRSRQLLIEGSGGRPTVQRHVGALGKKKSFVTLKAKIIDI